MGEMTLREALEEYTSVYMAYRNFAERTRVEYQNDLDDLAGFLERSGEMKVGELELGQIERYLAHLENKGYAGVTRKRKTITFRSFLSFLYRDGYIGSNIAKNLIPPFVDNKLPAFLTEPEYNRLREACAGNTRDAALVELLLQTGIRLSELTRLTLDDVEISDESGFIRIMANRGREERMIPLNSKACNALKAYFADRQDTGSSILFLNRFGEPLGDRGVQKMLRKYVKSADLGKASVHTLRHTFGTHHVANGTSLKTIQTTLGHKDPRSSSVYISLAYEMVRKEIRDNAL